MSTECKDYEFSQIEPYWQSFWEKNRSFRADDFSDASASYILAMFPYPSGDGLHTGHSENYTAPDILARYRRSKGINVLQPMGWDAFGLPTEQYAVETGIHPRAITARNVERFRRQLKRHGFAIDWDREINTTEPGYYRWTQWIFLQLFKHGLAYVDEKPVWWCPALGTVLANEEVVGGRSERGSHPVERRKLRQWVLRITAYADQLLEGLDDLDWPDSTKRQQISWIGRSVGTEVDFAIDGHPGEKLGVFTTRPDTLFGATYMVLSPEHPLVGAITRPEFRSRMEQYLRQAASKSDLDRTDLAKEKTGVRTGSFAVNPVNNRKIPIWVADYVLMSYGTGAIMAVPGHDERDFEFAQRFSLPIVRVIERALGNESNGDDPLPYTGAGRMINSGKYSGLESSEGIDRITKHLDKAGRGRRAINFKLHDWLFSRQRYWGEPFPIIWVDEVDYQRAQNNREGEITSWLPDAPVSYKEGERVYCALPVPACRLPIELPDMESFAPSGTGASPLANAPEWLNVWVHLATGECVPLSETAQVAGDWAKGRRETDTMPNWAGSCWYHLRFCDPANPEELVGRRINDFWGVPDFYIGGAEHAVLHLLYARFWHRFLFDIGVVSEPEPYKRLVHQGTILGKDGEKMSKSRGNVVTPDSVINQYGADSLRLYMMFMGPLQDMKPWRMTGIEGVHRFLRRLWRLFIDRQGNIAAHLDANRLEEATDTNRLLHQTIRKVTEDIESLRFNTAISQMMIFLNHAHKASSITGATARKFLQLLAPFAPHIAEELWERLGGRPSIMHEPWPEWDEAKLATDDVTIVFQINGRVRADARIPRGSDREQVLGLACEHQRVSPHLEGKTIVKVIYVPEKILNLVVS